MEGTAMRYAEVQSSQLASVIGRALPSGCRRVRSPVSISAGRDVRFNWEIPSLLLAIVCGGKYGLDQCARDR
jgi:hypothetical protein